MMDKIIDYILKGKGIGAVWLSVFSLISAIVFGYFCMVGGKFLVPYAQEVADQLLPVRIENGRIVEPEDSVRVATVKFSDDYKMQFPLVLNTTVDTLDVNGLDEGIYISRTAVYTVSRNQTKITPLSGDFDLSKQDYTAFFENAVSYFVIILAAFAFLGFLAAYFVLSLFYSFIAWGITLVLQRKADFEMRMRLSVCGIILLYTLSFIVQYAGGQVSSLLMFVLMVLFQGLFIYRGTARE